MSTIKTPPIYQLPDRAFLPAGGLSREPSSGLYCRDCSSRVYWDTDALRIECPHCGHSDPTHMTTDRMLDYQSPGNKTHWERHCKWSFPVWAMALDPSVETERSRLTEEAEDAHEIARHTWWAALSADERIEVWAERNCCPEHGKGLCPYGRDPRIPWVWDDMTQSHAPVEQMGCPIP